MNEYKPVRCAKCGGVFNEWDHVNFVGELRFHDKCIAESGVTRK